MSDTIVPQVMPPSKAYFKQLVKNESDSDCIEIDSSDYDSEELVNGKPVVKGLEEKSKRGYGLIFRQSPNGKPRH